MNSYTETIKGTEIIFKTKPGIFSKQGLDSGTRMLLQNLEIKPGTLVCDLGCGSGVIGIYIAKANYKGHVHLLDDHLRSTKLAEENVDLNKLKNAEVFLSDLFSAVPERTYHQIISNPSAQLGNEFLEEIIAESFKHLKPKGELYLVVVSHLKKPIERMLEKVFGSFEVVKTGKEHVVLGASKQ